jgi:hypothetical protein
VATPIDAVTGVSTPECSDSEIATQIRSAIFWARSASAPVSRIANSSPPYRATKSTSRTCSLRIVAIVRRTPSPARWPKASFTRFK